MLTAILVVNAGSSSMKLRVLSGDDQVRASTDLPAPRGAADAAQLQDAIASLGPAAELAETLEYRSGLAGVAGTADMREVLSRAAGGDAAAQLGREMYLHRLRGSIAAMAAAMDGLDALVFTGGVGENSAEIRSRAVDGLGFLGVRADAGRDAAGTGDREIGAPDATVRTLFIAAREDVEIARQVREILS